MYTDAQQFGRESEAKAARLLRRAGYRIVARNYRTPFGEIDLVAYDGDVLAFVEVKARRSERFGAPHASVTADKRRRLTRAAQVFLAGLRPARAGVRSAGCLIPAGRRDESPACRFDLVVVDRVGARDGARRDRIELLKDVFSSDGHGG
jgi:putative endonuclease